MYSLANEISNVFGTLFLLRYRLSNEIVGEGAFGVAVGGTDLLSIEPVVVKFSTDKETITEEYECLKTI